MMADATAASPVERRVLGLREAINDHDLEGLVASFAEDYAVEMPAHPNRSFHGRDQVRRNWEQIFAGVPDLHAELVGLAVDGDAAWAEWDWTGTRRDGARHHLRGVTVIGVRGDLIAWSRFYLEPVEEDGSAIDEAVRASLTAPGGRP